MVTVWMIAAAPPELRELLLAILNAQSRGAVSRPAALAPTATRALQLTAGARLRLFAEVQRHLLELLVPLLDKPSLAAEVLMSTGAKSAEVGVALRHLLELMVAQLKWRD